MALKFHCPKCNREVIFNRLKIGEISNCWNCGNQIIVPTEAITTDKDPNLIKHKLPSDITASSGDENKSYFSDTPISLETKIGITKRDFISLAFKITGTFCIFGVPLAILKASVDDATVLSLLTAIIIAGLFITGLLMIVIADRVARKLVTANKELKVIGMDIAPKDVFVLVLKIDGIFGIIISIQYCIELFLGIKTAHWRWIIFTILWVVIGIYFLSGAKHVVKFVFKKG